VTARELITESRIRRSTSPLFSHHEEDHRQLQWPCKRNSASPQSLASAARRRRGFRTHGQQRAPAPRRHLLRYAPAKPKTQKGAASSKRRTSLDTRLITWPVDKADTAAVLSRSTWQRPGHGFDPLTSRYLNSLRANQIPQQLQPEQPDFSPPTSPSCTSPPRWSYALATAASRARRAESWSLSVLPETSVGPRNCVCVCLRPDLRCSLIFGTLGTECTRRRFQALAWIAECAASARNGPSGAVGLGG
jgi:hypothetical protein